MKPCLLPSCPACGRSMVPALWWARATEPTGAVVLDLDPMGAMKATHEDPTVDVLCGGCGTTIRVGRDLPLAAA